MPRSNHTANRHDPCPFCGGICAEELLETPFAMPTDTEPRTYVARNDYAPANVFGGAVMEWDAAEALGVIANDRRAKQAEAHAKHRPDGTTAIHGPQEDR